MNRGCHFIPDDGYQVARTYQDASPVAPVHPTGGDSVGRTEYRVALDIHLSGYLDEDTFSREIVDTILQYFGPKYAPIEPYARTVTVVDVIPPYRDVLTTKELDSSTLPPDVNVPATEASELTVDDGDVVDEPTMHCKMFGAYASHCVECHVGRPFEAEARARAVDDLHVAKLDVRSASDIDRARLKGATVPKTTVNVYIPKDYVGPPVQVNTIVDDSLDPDDGALVTWDHSVKGKDRDWC